MTRIAIVSQAIAKSLLRPARTICLVSILTYIVGAVGSITPICAQSSLPPPPDNPHVAGRSDEGEQAIAGFEVREGMKIELVAAEPDVANPVAIWIDEKRRFYVAETFRQERGVEDNRDHQNWVDDDLAAQSIQDRLAYFKKHLKEKIQDYTRHDDRIRLLEDTTGDGMVDKATVFSNRYNGILEGTGAGILARRGDVYYANIPHLWKLKDANGDGRADERKSLHTGYGVRVAYRGHDLHGLVIGPDGKLYYSIGDRGYNVTAGGKHWKDPASGAVFRCNLDGSDLEVIATGFRNPQELAFDDFANLFTCDNNSDSGDKARWVYIVEGGDSGWRMNYQYLSDRGPFNREKLWHPYHTGQPAYIVPPVANLSTGPSGLTYYPGTGFPEEYLGTFFLCDFRGDAGQSVVRAIKLKPKGGGFEISSHKPFLWRMLATDVDFGPDGAMYISDWVHGWNGLGKGRIYRVSNAQTIGTEANQQAKRLLATGFKQRPTVELADLLTHPNRTVRQESQFALVEKNAAAELLQTAKSSDHQLARLHGIWGVAMLARERNEISVLTRLLPLLDDPNDKVRSQTAKVLGDARFADSTERLIASLRDKNLRVRYFAAIALGKIGNTKAWEPIVELLAENADQDPVLRHGGIMALVGCGDDKSLAGLAARSSTSVRIAAVVALRKRRSPAVAAFLNDSDLLVVLEAARAIYDDQPLDEVMPELAGLITRPSNSDPLLRRVLAANNRLGSPDAAEALARFAAVKTAPENSRLDALQLLKNWSKPVPRDPVSGQWRPLNPRDQKTAEIAFSKALPGILSSSASVRNEGAKLAASLGINEIRPVLELIYADKSQTADDRADALAALVDLNTADAMATIQQALADEQPMVRTRARDLFAMKAPDQALRELNKAMTSNELVERQGALATLATLTQPSINAVLSQALDDLLAGKFPADTRLDLVLAAKRRNSDEIRDKVTRYEKTIPADDAAARFRDCIAGGNAQRGRDIFFHRTELSCVRCHRHNGVGGDVGPDLTKIGKEKQARYLLEAIVVPNQEIAKGFETVAIGTDDGKNHTGILKREDDHSLRLITVEGKEVTIEKESISVRGRGKSSMPEDLVKRLNERELRDLVQFLKESR